MECRKETVLHIWGHNSPVVALIHAALNQKRHFSNSTAVVWHVDLFSYTPFSFRVVVEYFFYTKNNKKNKMNKSRFCLSQVSYIGDVFRAHWGFGYLYHRSGITGKPL